MKPNILHNLTRHCPICTNATGEILHTQRFVLPEGHPQAPSYDVVCCAECGFVFADTPTSQRDYEEYYTKFSRYTNSKASIGGGELAWDAGRLQHAAVDIARIVPDKRARIADIGCVGGGLLRTLHRLGYTNLCGIDPAPSCVEQTRQAPGIDAFVGSLSQIPAEAGPFDCAILSHVLEHVRDLRPALTYLRQFLNPGACIYVEVPDSLRYASFMLAPFQEFSTEHLNYFSLTSMTNLLHQCGFVPISSGTKVFLLAPNGAQPALFMFATPSASTPSIKKEEELKRYLENYITISRRMMDEIDVHLRRVLTQTPEVLVWGTGQLGLKLAAETALADAEIVAFVDSNPIYQGMCLRGRPILAPDQIEPGTTPIIIASFLHYHAICEDIRQLGLPNPVIALQTQTKTQAECIAELEITLRDRGFEYTNAIAFARSHEDN